MVINQFTKVWIGWSVAVFTGLYTFYLSKKYIDGHRYEAMKARERIAQSAYNPTDSSRPVPKNLKQ